MTALSVIDLFSGAGGFSLGAANAGFTVTAAIDQDRTLLNASASNFEQTEHLIHDLSLPPKCLIDTLARHGITKPNVVVGGPPCQGFSLIGKRNTQDPRNNLVTQFFRHVRALEPDAFVFENVPGISQAYGAAILKLSKALVDDLYDTTNEMTLDPAEYGGATRRPRLFVVGIRKGLADMVEVGKYIASRKLYAASVGEAIGDLFPFLSTDVADQTEWRAASSPSEQSAYVRKLNRVGGLRIDQKRIDRISKGVVTGVGTTAHSPKIVERFSETAPGTRERISRFPRLSWTGVAPTLRAGTGADRGSFQSVRPIHPDVPRVITVREAARIQGFPDWFIFHKSKWHSFRMIGNSVSPTISEVVMSALRECLTKGFCSKTIISRGSLQNLDTVGDVSNNH